MTPLPRPLALATIALLIPLPGCVAKTLADVATAPVRLGAGAVDMATTSQSEADEKRGRTLREREERRGRLERSYNRNARACEDGDRGACERARRDYAQIRDLTPDAPAGRY